MRRGLISHSKAELPDAVLDARIARLRAAMAQARLDALLVYTNNTRTAGVSWLTGFVPYWSEALLVVPRERRPVLVVALTYRVKSWIERTSRVADVIHTPRIGLEAARLIARMEARRGGRRRRSRWPVRRHRRRSARRRAAADLARRHRTCSSGCEAKPIRRKSRWRRRPRRSRTTRFRARPRTQPASATSSPMSRQGRDCSVPKRSTWRPLPIWRVTSGCGGSKARWRSASASRCAPPSPTRARGFAWCGPSPATVRRR